MARRKPPFRTGTALPNACEHQKAETRLESARTFVRSGHEDNSEPAPDARPRQKPAQRAGANPGATAREEKSRAPSVTPSEPAVRKRTIRGAAVWLPEDMARFEALASATGTDVNYVQKAVVRNAGKTLRTLDGPAAACLGVELQQHLHLRRPGNAGASEVNGYLTNEALAALRKGLNDPFAVISDYRIVSTAFRVLGLQTLSELEESVKS